ncbi:hypothetical protein F5882DRAFT_379750 [Hyaloscypha sp. PMI_1271]|nr:hypothetical protein F5882DRAFT_379750 [Hyaloscypha sp. PMI_1271]
MVFPNCQNSGEALAARDDGGGKNPPGLQKNKNGPPGPAGNQKGPPSKVPATVAPVPPASQTTSPGTSSSTSSSSNTPSPTPPTPFSTPSPTAPLSVQTTSTSTSSPPTYSSPSITSIIFPPSTSSKKIYVSFTQTTELPTTPHIGISSQCVSSSVACLLSGSSSLSTTLFAVETTLQTSASSATAQQTGQVCYAPNSIAPSGHKAASPGQKVGIAVGTIGMFKSVFCSDYPTSKANDQAAGFGLILALILLLFRRYRGEIPKALPCLARRRLTPGSISRWWTQNQTPPEISDALLTPKAGSRGSLGWDYRATFARPTVIEKSRRSLPRSLRRLVRFNPLRQNPVAPHAPGEGTPSRSSFASFFRRRSTASVARSVIDVESPPSLPPLPAGLSPPRPPTISVSRDFVQSEADEFLRPQAFPIQVLPPAFHRSWCYRNSQTSLASVESENRSFVSVPGWVKFHYPRISGNDRGVYGESSTPLPAPQALSPGSWLNAKILRRSQSTINSSKKGTQTGSDSCGESGSTESPVLGPSGWKQTQVGHRVSSESAGSLMVEKPQPWQI